MRRLRSAVTCSALALLAALTLATTAVPAQAVLPSKLILSFYKGQTADPASLQRTAILTCDPDGGTHPQPVKACDALRSVNGYIAKLPGNPDIFCPLIFDPRTATAKGTWRGRPVRFQHTYGNDCELHRASTPVFDF